MIYDRDAMDEWAQLAGERLVHELWDTEAERNAKARLEAQTHMDIKLWDHELGMDSYAARLESLY